MKSVIFAFIVWSSGDLSSYEIDSVADCVDLTARLGPYVESANCYDFPAYLSANIAPELALDYFPPEE